MSDRELVVLGTASQAPTRYRNHNGYLLRWDGTDILFDPGEGTQRQMLWAGVTPAASGPSASPTSMATTAWDCPVSFNDWPSTASPIRCSVLFPASGRPFFDRLRHASVFS